MATTDLGVLDSEVIVVCASLLRGAVQIFEARSPHVALPRQQPLGERRNMKIVDGLPGVGW